MEGSAQFCLLVVLLFVAPDSAEAQKTPSHFKLGGTLTLRPPFSGTITSIVYKFKGNLVAEYADSGVPLTYYSSFKGRTTLNTTTGELEIRNMGKDDIGEFVVEINNVVQSQRFESVEIKDVPDPSVILRPLSCGSSSPSCSLFCGGDIKESGPVTFSWRKDDGPWKESEQVMDITNDEETKQVKTFTCRMKNPVSEKESEPEHNPFHPGSDSNNSDGGGAGTVVGIVVGILIVVILAVCVVCYLKRETITPLLNRYTRRGGSEASKPNSPGDHKSETVAFKANDDPEAPKVDSSDTLLNSNATGNVEAAKSEE